MSTLSELVTALAAAEQSEVLPDKETVIVRLQEQLNTELERLAGREKCVGCGEFTPVEHLAGYVKRNRWFPSHCTICRAKVNEP